MTLVLIVLITFINYEVFKTASREQGFLISTKCGYEITVFESRTQGTKSREFVEQNRTFGKVSCNTGMKVEDVPYFITKFIYVKP